MNKYGYCKHGEPYWVTTNYNGTKIIYHFVICERHKTYDVKHHHLGLFDLTK